MKTLGRLTQACWIMGLLTNVIWWLQVPLVRKLEWKTILQILYPPLRKRSHLSSTFALQGNLNKKFVSKRHFIIRIIRRITSRTISRSLKSMKTFYSMQWKTRIFQTILQRRTVSNRRMFESEDRASYRFLRILFLVLDQKVSDQLMGK